MLHNDIRLIWQELLQSQVCDGNSAERLLLFLQAVLRQAASGAEECKGVQETTGECWEYLQLVKS